MVCKEIVPEVVNLGQAYDGKVKIIRIDVDVDRAAAQKYGVRATPSFLIFDANGTILGGTAGWPGYEKFDGLLTQLLVETP